MSNHVLVIVNAAQYDGKPNNDRAALQGAVREFLKDKFAVPMDAPKWTRASDGTQWYVACYWAEHTKGLDSAKTERLNTQYAGFATITLTDDPQAVLAAAGLVAPKGEIP